MYKQAIIGYFMPQIRSIDPDTGLWDWTRSKQKTFYQILIEVVSTLSLDLKEKQKKYGMCHVYCAV